MIIRCEVVLRSRLVKKEDFQYYRGMVDNIPTEIYEDNDNEIFERENEALAYFQEYRDKVFIEDSDDWSHIPDDSYLVSEYVVTKYEMGASPGYFDYERRLEVLARSFRSEDLEQLENSKLYRKEYQIYKSEEFYPVEDFEYFQGMNRVNPVNNRHLQLLETFYTEEEALKYFEQYEFATKREKEIVEGEEFYKVTEYWIEASYVKDSYTWTEEPIKIGIINTSRSKEYEDRMEAEAKIERTCILARHIWAGEEPGDKAADEYYKGITFDIGGVDEKRVSIVECFDNDEDAIKAFEPYKYATQIVDYEDPDEILSPQIVEYFVERCILIKEYWDDYIVWKSVEVLDTSEVNPNVSEENK